MTNGSNASRNLLRRRAFLRAGLVGFGSLSLPGLLRLCAEAGMAEPGDSKAVILVWLRGGGEPSGNLRPQARCPRRVPRAVQGHRHANGRPAHQRAAPAARPDLESVCHPPLDGPHGRGPPLGVAATALRRPRRAGQAQAGLPRLHERRPLSSPRDESQAARLRRRQSDRALRQLHHRGLRLPGRVVCAVRRDGRSECPGLPRAQHRPRRRGPGAATGRASRAPEGRSTRSAATWTVPG